MVEGRITVSSQTARHLPLSRVIDEIALKWRKMNKGKPTNLRDNAAW